MSSENKCAEYFSNARLLNRLLILTIDKACVRASARTHLFTKLRHEGVHDKPSTLHCINPALYIKQHQRFAVHFSRIRMDAISPIPISPVSHHPMAKHMNYLSIV